MRGSWDARRAADEDRVRGSNQVASLSPESGTGGGPVGRKLLSRLIKPSSVSPTMPSNRRQRRSLAQAAKRRVCDVPHCEQVCKKTLSACPHAICNYCLFHSLGALDYDEREPHFAVSCPICRQRYDLDVDGVKPFMASVLNLALCAEFNAQFAIVDRKLRYAPTHVKEMRCSCPDDCGKTFIIMHRACSLGCYHCNESSLDIDLIGVHGHGIDTEGELSDVELSESTSR